MGQELIRDIMSSLTEEQREQLWSSLSTLYREVLKELGIEDDILLLP